MNREDAYFAALRARDARFDGKFFVGVKTTGIYCRPVCPAKPKRENVEFFTTAAAAERRGYRPCLRCRPESAPNSPVWIGTSAVVRRALRTLHADGGPLPDEAAFAASFGVGARHLRRLFIAETGQTPKQIHSAIRLNLAHRLVRETALPLAEIAQCAGFRSIRRFNDAFQARFRRPPREMRRAPARENGVVRLYLAYRPPLDFGGLLGFYRAHRVGDLEAFGPGEMRRTFVRGGKTGTVSITDDPGRSRLVVDVDFPDTREIAWILTRVRALFDLDSDPAIIANALERDPRAKRLLKSYPGIRLPSGWDPFEVGIGAILGQFVSVERGRALVKDLIDLVGTEEATGPDGGRVKLFPAPGALARAYLAPLKTTEARKRSLRAFAHAVATGSLSLDEAQDVDGFVRAALALPGIGPWTANYMAMKMLRHADAYPGTDLILARAAELHPETMVDRMRPWRAYAAALFWRAYAGTLRAKGKKT